MFDYIVTGVCYINRNIKHYIIPYIKNDYFPELQKMGTEIFTIIKMTQGIHN